MDKNYYAVLQVPRQASQEVIKAAYRRLAKEFHPDVRPNDKAAEETFKVISEAYNVLSDPAEKRAYDMGHAYAGTYGGDMYGPGAYSAYASRNPRGRGTSERDREWAESAWDEDAASFAEVRMRRAREAQAAKAKYVRDEGPDVADDPLDVDEWNRMHFGPTEAARAAGAAQGARDAQSGGGGASFKRAGVFSGAEQHAMNQAAFATAGASETQQYRQFAEAYRAARRAQERQWPKQAAAAGLLLLCVYKFVRAIQER